jgi:hypothetical protein
MMFEIGKRLGFIFDKRDLAKYSYTPQGWVDTEAEQKRAADTDSRGSARKARFCRFSPFQPNPASDKFPPPATRFRGMPDEIQESTSLN